MKVSDDARLGELVAGITVGVETEAEAETAFYQRFQELISLPAEALLAGQPVTLVGFESLGRAGRFRARVKAKGGPALWVGLDTLDLSLSGTHLNSLVAAYRYWLGYSDVTLDDGASTAEVVPNETITNRVEDLRFTITSVAEELDTLDFSEIEQWVGDDDPWGRNKKYWSNGAYRYLELVEELAKLSPGIEEVARTGARRAAAELSLELLEALQAAAFDGWHHDDVQHAAHGLLRFWLKTDGAVGLALHQPESAVAIFTDRIVEFGLEIYLNGLVADVDFRVRDALISKLVTEALQAGPPKQFSDNRWAEALVVMRYQGGDLDKLLQDLPLGYWSARQMEKILGSLASRGETQRSLELAETWIAEFEAREGKPPPSRSEVCIYRRALLDQLGRGGEALTAIMEGLTKRPSGDRFVELAKLVGDAQPKLLEEALDLVASDLNELVRVASQLPTARVAERIAALSVSDFRRVFSFFLEPAADVLVQAHPSAAVRLYAALGWAHVDPGKSKHYGRAHEAFEKARDLYMSLGRAPEWEAIAREVMDEHARKRSFMPGFQRITSLSRQS